MAEVKFIRRKGKIIPIRTKKGAKKGKKAKKSGGKREILAGLGIAGAGGRAAGRAASDAARVATRSSFNTRRAASELAIKSGKQDKFIKKAAKQLRISRGAVLSGKGFALAGSTIGAAFITTGLQKRNPGQETVGENVGFNIAGALAGIATTAAFKSAKPGRAIARLRKVAAQTKSSIK